VTDRNQEVDVGTVLTSKVPVVREGRNNPYQLTLSFLQYPRCREARHSSTMLALGANHVIGLPLIKKLVAE
jgi:hypothetical protein